MNQTLIKAVLIGDSGVGKSSLYSRLESNTYDEDHLPTIGGSFAKLSIPTRNDGTYDVGLWDTAGQERYRDIIPMYFERADFILAVFGLNDRASFEHLPRWIASARDRAENTAKVIVLGNKCDLDAAREVTADEMMRYAAECGAAIGIETSAKSSAGLDLLVQSIATEWRGMLAMRLSAADAPAPRTAVERRPPKSGPCC
jgi:small GTP-binding protein